MVFTYGDMIDRYGSAYQISRAVKAGEVYKLARGVYSDVRHPDPNAIVCTLYPQAVLTMDSAFFLHGLTDVFPEAVHVATPRGATRIRMSEVRQHFMRPELMRVGVRLVAGDDLPVRVFSRERMLVELLRNAAKLPVDYYRELIAAYRRIAHDLDMSEVDASLVLYRRSDALFDMLQREVL